MTILGDGWYRLRRNDKSKGVTIVLVIFGRVIHAHETMSWHWPGPGHEVPPNFILGEPPGPELDDWLWEKMPTPGAVVEARSYVLDQGASGDPPSQRGDFIFWFIVGVLVSAFAAMQVLGALER